MRSILNLVQNKERYNILTFPTHERYQSDMNEINADFYLYRKPPHIKDWNQQYAKLPDNHFILPIQYLPIGIDFDFVLSQNRFGQYQEAYKLAKQLQIPLVNIEHTLPLNQWNPNVLNNMKQMRGHVNIYISEFSANQWEEPEPQIIRHCVNTDLFKSGNLDRAEHILTIANDYPGRNSVLGFDQYLRVTNGLPTHPVGDSPGFSKPADSIEDLVLTYNSSRIFLNTSTWSPIPKSLLEAMSCGCAVVSTNNCAIPYYIDHGINGMLANNDKEMRQYLEMLLEDKDFANFLGENARKTIIEKCDKNKFTEHWNKIFNQLAQSQLRIVNEN